MQNDSAYGKNKYRNLIVLAAMAVLLVLFALVSLKCGSYSTSVTELVKGVFGAADERINAVVQGVRLPRIYTALVCGAGLGVTGCVLQAILNNPLASASTLGISQGASFGAAFAIMVLGAGTAGLADSFLVSACAFLSSMLVSIIILVLSKLRAIGPEAMVLAGVALSALFTGATTLLQYFASETELASFVFWTFGDLGSTTRSDIALISVVVAVFFVYFIFNRWTYNALDAGEHTAVSLGINVGKTRVINILACSFVSATIVSYIGLISFIGLCAPHIVRRLVGTNYVWLIPGSAFMGAVLMLGGDLVARTVISPVILPIGAITSFLGAPMFLYLLFKGGKKRA